MKKLLMCSFLNRQHSNKVKGSMLLLGIFCLFAVTACAVRTPVPQIPASLVAENLKYENIVFEEFDLARNHRSNVPTAGPLAECMTSSINYLTSKDVFKRVEKATGISSRVEGEGANLYDEPTLVVEASLTFLRIVKGAARFFGGVLVGRSAMKMNVTLTDASTGTVVAQQELVGAPNAYSSAWTFGAADRSLPTKMGYLLGDLILANVSEK